MRPPSAHLHWHGFRHLAVPSYAAQPTASHEMATLKLTDQATKDTFRRGGQIRQVQSYLSMLTDQHKGKKSCRCV